jgi:hypothetical protein
MIPAALRTLQNATSKFDSHLSREALRTAHSLVQAARTKRGKELESLDIGLGVVGDFIPSPIQNSIPSGVNFQWSTIDNEFGLSNFLDFDGYGFDNEASMPLPMDAFPEFEQNHNV